jgi:hypothetical protein
VNKEEKVTLSTIGEAVLLCSKTDEQRPKFYLSLKTLSLDFGYKKHIK